MKLRGWFDFSLYWLELYVISLRINPNPNLIMVIVAADVRWCATVAWVLFELMEHHLLTLLCYVMIVALAMLFLWSNVTMFIHKYVHVFYPMKVACFT